jgi:hypothetical protein
MSRLEAKNQGIVVRFPEDARYIFPFQNTYTGFESHPAFF